jgi:hypothetical protein
MRTSASPFLTIIGRVIILHSNIKEPFVGDRQTPREPSNQSGCFAVPVAVLLGRARRQCARGRATTRHSSGWVALENHQVSGRCRLFAFGVANDKDNGREAVHDQPFDGYTNEMAHIRRLSKADSQADGRFIVDAVRQWQVRRSPNHVPKLRTMSVFGFFVPRTKKQLLTHLIETVPRTLSVASRNSSVAPGTIKYRKTFNVFFMQLCLTLWTSPASDWWRYTGNLGMWPVGKRSWLLQRVGL